MVVLYTLTIAIGAAMLFLIEPMFARQILPLLGGSPAVWNTAMLFFQAMLLVAYGYAHLNATRISARRQVWCHLTVLALPFVALPVAVPPGWSPPTQTAPILWLLALLTVSVGLPFFAVATTSPLLQRWFSVVRHARARDPYFLYAASNIGSMFGLLAYPLWVEPHWRIPQQTRFWTWGYGLLVALTTGCAYSVWRSAPAGVPPVFHVASPPLRTAQRGRWVLLAFAPSSLMLGVTTYLSSEIAVVPLLWIVPLALYLLSFVLSFGLRLPRRPIARAFPLLAIVWVLLVDMLVTQPIGALMSLHLAAFFVASLLCHAELAATRPPADRLTEFYLWVSFGGVLGGVFNAVLAPLIFNSVAEYPIAFTLACWLALPPRATVVAAGVSLPARRRLIGDWLWPLVLGMATLGAALVLRTTSVGAESRPTALVFGAGALVCYFFSQRPGRFALGIGALLLAGYLCPGQEGRVLVAERSFFGVHRVLLESNGAHHVLLNGVTVHGRQSLDPASRDVPLSYYHPTGPAGDVFRAFGRTASANIAVVGLGAGSLASYGRAGQRWTFFEIDPVVKKLAEDTRYFTFLHDSAAQLRIVLGDARRSLVREPDRKYDLVILDAYSSDAIPMHLVTREALALYVRKLAPGGRLVFHISNRHLDLEPMFANLARDAGLVALTRDDTQINQEEIAMGKSPSKWLVMAHDPNALEQLANNPRWTPSRPNPSLPLWTDDYSSILKVLRWK